MLCEKILCNMKELADSGDKKIDYVDFEWDEAFKKIHKKTSRAGVEVGLRLEDSVLTQGIRTGDVFYMDEEQILAASILPCKVIEVHVREDHPHMVAKVCYEIGNRHATLLWGEGENTFITPYTQPLMELLQKLHGVEVVEKNIVLDFDKRISASVNSHTH